MPVRPTAATGSTPSNTPEKNGGSTRNIETGIRSSDKGARGFVNRVSRIDGAQPRTLKSGQVVEDFWMDVNVSQGTDNSGANHPTLRISGRTTVLAVGQSGDKAQEAFAELVHSMAGTDRSEARDRYSVVFRNLRYTEEKGKDGVVRGVHRARILGATPVANG